MTNTVEKFGIYFDGIGLNKTYGRIFGIFMTSNRPISMKELVEQLHVSKSTVSTELRRLMAMGVIEKVLVTDQRADYYQLKKNIWVVNLKQKIEDIKNLRMIAEGIPPNELNELEHLQELATYCSFMEEELEVLAKKYTTVQLEKNIETGNMAGSYIEPMNKHLLFKWYRFPALSEGFADRLAELATLGIDCFKTVELDFFKANPQAIEEDKNLAHFKKRNHDELETLLEEHLSKIFYSRPSHLSNELKTYMANVYYYLISIHEKTSKSPLGFITFMSNGFKAQNEYKITMLAIDKSVRRSGLASLLVNALNRIGVKYKRLIVSTRPTNFIAINAYTKWGFTEDKEIYKNSSHFIKNHWVHFTK